MVRPTKSVHTMSKNLTKAEKTARIEAENVLRGASDLLQPPDRLNEKQAAIFEYIVDQMAASKVLGNLDIYVLESCVIAIERLQYIESLINDDPGLMFDGALLRARKAYKDTFFKCCNELSLSPQSRAKLGVINVQAKQKDGDELLKVLRGGVK